MTPLVTLRKTLTDKGLLAKALAGDSWTALAGASHSGNGRTTYRRRAPALPAANQSPATSQTSGSRSLSV